MHIRSSGLVALAAVSASAMMPTAGFAAEDSAALHVAYRIYASGKLVAAPEIDIRPGDTATMDLDAAKVKLRTAVTAGSAADRYTVATTLSVRSGGKWVDLPGWQSESNGTAGTTVTRTAPDGTPYRLETTLGGGFLGKAGGGRER